MSEQFKRTEMLLGAEAMDKLAGSRVIVFGVGGVGGYVCEALARSGVGELDIVDKDMVDITNLNRQIIATRSTVGRPKTEVMAERIRDINPDCLVHEHQCFYLPDTKDQFDFSKYDYVVDAVDTVTAKLTLVEEAKAHNVPIISSMGAGNKLDPTAFRVADISKTSVDRLAKVMRRELKKRGIKDLKVVYSTEEAVKPVNSADAQEETVAEGGPESGGRRKDTPGSIAFIPSVVGLIIAGEVIKDLICIKNEP